ncbi:MAG: helix-turn-helix domain-containing protein [Streptosporangiales bacterium]|nr:helix-turn-helix domain-containing protein [Streptosporangiales bacterium]
MPTSLRTITGTTGGSRKAFPDDSDLGRILFERINEGAFHAPIRKLPSAVHLYSWGDSGDWLYLIQSGWVKSVTWSWGGKPCLLAINGPTDLLGVSSLITRQRSETAMTKTQAEIRVIAGDQFQQIMADALLRDAWHRYLTGWIADQQEALTHFVTLDSKQRLATTLLRLARKHGVRTGPALSITCRITHDELGQMVGTTRSRVGYFLRCFEDDQLVERRSQAIVVHEDRLLQYLLAAS